MSEAIHLMSEYDKGKRLTLHYIIRQAASGPNNAGSSPTSLDPQKLPFEVEIVHAFQPFTLAVVCKVRVLTQPSPEVHLPSVLVIKLNDRRYCWNPRSRFDQGRPWSAAKEAAYQRFLQSDTRPPDEELKHFMTKVEPGTEGGFEASIEYSGQAENRAEIKAYEYMENIQGRYVPTFYGEVEYTSTDMPKASSDGEPLPSTYTSCGIIIEYIPSITLERYLQDAMAADPVPVDRIVRVCDSAIELMDRLGDIHFIYKDLRLENFLVASPEYGNDPCRPSQSPVDAHCVAVDFASVRFRYPDETDEQWRRARETIREELAIGAGMKHIIRKTIRKRGVSIKDDDVWRYKRSTRWDREYNTEEQAAYEDEPGWGLYPVSS